MVVTGRIQHPTPPGGLKPDPDGKIRYRWEDRLQRPAMPISRRSRHFVDPSKATPEELEAALSGRTRDVSELPEIPSMDALAIPKSTQESLRRGFGVEQLTPIQAETLPVLREGHSAMLRAPPGTGKTFAFLLPALDQLEQGGRVVIVVPNTTLAEQTLERLKVLLRFDHPRRQKIFSYMDPTRDVDPDTPLDETAEPLEEEEFERQFDAFAKQVLMRDSEQADDTRPLEDPAGIPVPMSLHDNRYTELKQRE